MILGETQRRSGRAAETNILYLLGIRTVNRSMYLLGIVACENSIHEEIKRKVEARECWLSFGAESSVFLFDIQKYKGLVYRTVLLPFLFVLV